MKTIFDQQITDETDPEEVFQALKQAYEQARTLHPEGEDHRFELTLELDSAYSRKNVLVAKTNQIWRGHPLTEGDEYPEEVSDGEKGRLIRNGLAIEVEKRAEPDYPDDFPEGIKNLLVGQGITQIGTLKDLHEAGDLQKIDQVGPSTETKIQNYFDQ